MTVTLRITCNDTTARQTVTALAANLQPAMRIVGEIVRTSVVKNFEAGGRPTLWQISQRAKKSGGKTLIKRGRLMNSITVSAGTMSVEIGTNLIYARIHQLGGTINHPARERVLNFRQAKRGAITFGRPGMGDKFSRPGKAHYSMKVHGSAYTITMPKREFLLVQPEDWTEIKAALEEYLKIGPN